MSNAAVRARTDREYQGGYTPDDVPEYTITPPASSYPHPASRRRVNVDSFGGTFNPHPRLDHAPWHDELIAELYADSGDPS